MSVFGPTQLRATKVVTAGDGAGPVRLPVALGLSLTGGLGLAAAFDPYGLTPGALVGPVLLLIALRGQPLRRSVLIGLVFGLAFQGVLLVWLAQSIGAGAWVGLVALQASWFGVLGVLVCLTMRLPGSPLWFAVAWTAVETARSSWPFGGFPWGRLGFLALDTPWAGSLPYLGVAGVGFLVALAAGLLGRGVDRRGFNRGRSLAGAAAVVATGLVPLVVPYSIASDRSMTVAVVQGNVPGDGRDLVAHHRTVTENHARATQQLADQVARGAQPRPDLVVWPENSTAVDPVTDQVARASIQSAVDAIGAPVLVGGMVDGPTAGTVLNQGIVWHAEGPSTTRYTKHHPVPFGEYIPFRQYLGALSPRLAEVPRDMLPGTATTPLEVAGTSVADAICFDVAYDEVLADQVRAGGRLVVVQTSNASFTGTAQLDQQFAMTRARALETGRAVAVASTNGVTAVIAPTGEVVQRAPLRETAVLVAEVPLADEITPAVRWGTRPGEIALGVALAGALAGTLRLRRAGRG